MRFAAALYLLLMPVNSVFAADPSPHEPEAAADERAEFWLTWDSQNSRAKFQKARREVLDITLVIDPSKSRMSKLDGTGRFVGSVPLPEHTHWKAFHVTPQGIAELTFPVRLQWVHSSQALSERIFIRSLDVMERNSNEAVRFAMGFAPQTASTGGYGIVPATATFQFAENHSEPDRGVELKSMLLGVDQSSLKYKSTITVGTTVMSVDSNE